MEDKLFSLRMPGKSRKKLDMLAGENRRNLSDMVLWLIDEEFRRMERAGKMAEVQNEDALVGGVPEGEKECE